MKTKYQILVFVLGIYSLGYCQDILWEKNFGGDKVEYLFDALPTKDYGYLLAGSSLSSAKGDVAQVSQGNYDYWIWKMDENGKSEWQKSFGGDGHDLLKSIKHTNDGGFILAGTSNSNLSLQKKSNSFGLEDLWIIKLNASGNEDWQINLGGPSQDYLSSIESTLDGGYIIGATSNSNSITDVMGKNSDNQGGLDYWIIKIDNKGKIEWQKNLGGNYEDQLTQVISTSKGFLVAGYSNSSMQHEKKTNNIGATDFWAILLDVKGKELWQKNYGKQGVNILKSVLRTKDNNIILAGEHTPDRENGKSSETSFQIIKINEDGNVVWEKTHQVTAINQLTNIIENQDKTLVISGYGLPQNTVAAFERKKQKINEGENDYILVKLSEEGDELWQKIIGSNGQDQLTKTIETRDGSYLLAGTSDGKSSRDKQSNSQANDFWIVKLKDNQKQLIEKKTIEAFPNPTAQFTNVIVGYEFKSGTATVVDLGGRVLQTFNIDSRTVPVDLSGYPEGIYIVNIKTEVQSNGVKVIKGGNKN